MEQALPKKQVLVTGGNGFVGIHVILQLLQQGYRVKTTLRSLSKQQQVLDMLRNSGVHDFENLSFIEADLLNDTNWDEAVSDCTYVLHVASPIFLALPKDEDEMIRPAVEGTLRVLKASRNAGVKRVVMTSNFGAVGYSHRNPDIPITEKDWTNPKEKGLSSYNRSKVLAERAAWDFMEKEGGKLELSVINPTAIFGPSFTPVLSSGFQLLKGLLDGSMKAIPNMRMNIIDVRDVADLHIRAMTNPNAAGERFLALAGGSMTLPEIATLIKTQVPELQNKIPNRILKNWMVGLAGWFSPRAKAIYSMLRANRNVSNNKARQVLHWEPQANNEEAVLASIKSMLKFGNI